MYQSTWKNEKLFKRFDKDSFDIPSSGNLKSKNIEKAAPLYWEEHCIECAVPSCFNSCPLYVKRGDGKCSRFTYGIFTNYKTKGLFDFGADVNFERWAKLESFWPKNPKMIPIKKIQSENAWIFTIQSNINFLLDRIKFIDRKHRINHFFSWLIERWIRLRLESISNTSKPDALYLQFFYPGKEKRSLHLEVYGDEPIFRCNIPIKSGWNEKIIQISSIPKNFNGIGRISIWPSDDRPLRLIFNWLDLVSFSKSEVMPAEKVKCVCWDLDNTLWDGVIGDEGRDGVIVKKEMILLIEELDKRGILQSIVSKNEHEIAWKKIEDLGLKDYFIYPAIHWGSKSESIRKIASELNINLDTFAIFDDSPWEREEVISRFPQVRAYDTEKDKDILMRKEFSHPVTKESVNRRKMYLKEASRKKILANWDYDLESFLKSCEMEMQIALPDKNGKKRCLELLQRSNQFNLSGNKYDEKKFDELFSSNGNECFYASLKDKFGKYGIIMFIAIGDIEKTPTIIEFVMSCRVANKMADIAFLSWYANRAKKNGKDVLNVQLKITEKNKPLRDVLKSFQFKDSRSLGDNRMLLEISLNKESKAQDIIKITSPE